MKKLAPSPSGKFFFAVMVLSLWPLVSSFGIGTTPLKSAPLTLAWNAAEDLSVKGYGIYYGLTNQPTTNYVNAGTNLSVTFFDLLADTGYRFYAVSYDAAGNESVPSNELLVTPRLLSRMRIVRLPTGECSLAVRAAPGSVCQVEFTTAADLGNWQVLGLAVADANGDVVLIDPASRQEPSRFYRVARLINPTLESPKSPIPDDAWELL